MDRRERERIMREGGHADSPVDQAKQRNLAEDLEGSPLRGRPLRRRLRNFRPAADSYIASLGGPLPYMQRLREIEVRLEQHRQQLQTAWDELRAESESEPTFARRWRELAERWPFDEVNDLIDRHNRYFPTEARLPMDPRTGDFVLIQGRRYEREPVDAAWILERFPVAGLLGRSRELAARGVDVAAAGESHRRRDARAHELGAERSDRVA